MKQNLWLTPVTCLAYCLGKGLWKAIEYLPEQVRVLKEDQKKDKGILLNDYQRIRLATKSPTPAENGEDFRQVKPVRGI